MTERVNHPPHYGGADNPYETIKVLKAWLTPEQYIGFLRGNAIKYESRLYAKGNAAEDAAKASWYAHELAKELAANKAAVVAVTSGRRK